MCKLIIGWVVLAACYACSSADVSHVASAYASSTPPQAGPASPYIFSYSAGRAEGHVDRQHTEVSDGTGVIRGAFSYVDPKNQLRTVQYVADANGFHPQLSHEVEDSEAVKREKQKHLALYNRIAQEHASQAHPQAQHNVAPNQSEAVVRATNKHLNLFDRIAAEHAAIGAAQAEEARKALATAGADQYGQVGNDGLYRPETY